MLSHVGTGQIRTSQVNLDQVKLSQDMSSWTKNDFGPGIFWTKFFSDKKLFWASMFFRSKLFWTQNALENGFWLWHWPNLFNSLNLGICSLGGINDFPCKNKIFDLVFSQILTLYIKSLKLLCQLDIFLMRGILCWVEEGDTNFHLGRTETDSRRKKGLQESTVLHWRPFPSFKGAFPN